MISPATRPRTAGLAPSAVRRPRPHWRSALIAAGLAAAIVAPGVLAADPSPPSSEAAASPAAASPQGPAAPAFVPGPGQASIYELPPIQAPPILTPTDLADGHALGAADAPVTVELWEDFQCPFCQEFAFTVKPRIIDAYVLPGKVRLVYRDMAFLGEESRWASVAASLAADQGAFWPYHDYLFGNLVGENVGSYSTERLVAIAAALGLDTDAFVAGLQVDAARARFAERQALIEADGQAYGISGTPTVVVDGRVVTRETDQGPRAVRDWDSVKAAIDGALAAAAGAPGASAGAGAAPGQEPSGGPDASADAVASPTVSEVTATSPSPSPAG